MTRNQVTWLLGKESNKINQQNADTNVANAQTNVVNAQTNRANLTLAQEESHYNRSANIWGSVISAITSVATVLLAILL